MENGEKSKPNLRIEHINPEYKGDNNLENPEDRKMVKVDQNFLEEVREKDPETAARIVADLKEQLSRLNKDELDKRSYMVESLNILNLIYKFEQNEEEKEKIKKDIYQVDFALRQLLLS